MLHCVKNPLQCSCPAEFLHYKQFVAKKAVVCVLPSCKCFRQIVSGRGACMSPFSLGFVEYGLFLYTYSYSY
jgi:hypothetical protein